MRPQYPLEETPVSEVFEDSASPNARSLVIKSIFKLLIKQKRFPEAPEYMVQLELWLLYSFWLQM